MNRPKRSFLFALSCFIFSDSVIPAEPDAATVKWRQQYLEYTENMQKVFSEAAKELFDALRNDEKEILRNPDVRIGARNGASIECRDLGNMAKITYEPSLGAPTIWMCMEPIAIATELSVTMLFLSFNEMAKTGRISVTDFQSLSFQKNVKKAALYYANILFDIHSDALLTRRLGKGYCRAWTVAYLLSNDEPVKCDVLNETSNTVSEQWVIANVKKLIGPVVEIIKAQAPQLMDEMDLSQPIDVREIASDKHYQLVKFIIAHELGHMVDPAARPISSNRTSKDRLKIEIAADTFAIKRVSDPWNSFSLALLWESLKEISEEFRLSQDETALRGTSIFTVLCEPKNAQEAFKNNDDAQILKLVLPYMCSKGIERLIPPDIVQELRILRKDH